MKNTVLSILTVGCVTLASSTMAQSSIYDFKVDGLTGEEINFADFKGKKILIVNTASKCGFTKQYTQLQELYDKHGKNIVVVGFPANNFGKQEPGTNQEIDTFCKKNYGVSFPMCNGIFPSAINYQLYYTPSYYVIYPDSSYVTFCPAYCQTTSSSSTIENLLNTAIQAWLPPVYGCTDPLSCNYNCLATVNDGSCLYPNTACDDGNPLTINDSTDINCNCTGQLVTIVEGCTDPASCNYNPLANVDDGSCLYPGQLCDDNNPNTINDSINPDCICIGDIVVLGCTDPNSCTYNPLANVDDNSCIYPDSPCDDNNPDTYNDMLDSTCNCVGTLYIYGCMDSSACNYNPLATMDDNSCILPGSPCDDGNDMTINDSLDVNCNCVGIDITGLIENQMQLELYPNPSSNSFVVATNFAAQKLILITDLQGKILLEINSNKAEELIDCSQLANGTYLVKVSVHHAQLTKKLHIHH